MPANRCLVVGYGSIGQRHVRVLTALGHDVAVLSRRPISYPRRFSGLAEALADFAPSYIVVANETSAHRASLAELARRGYAEIVLVEKPLFEALRREDPVDVPRTFVAYNLRFHPLLQRLREWLRGREAVTATIHVGQHLSTWRPGRDFRATYSARRDQGGGALRDLSHELDYVLWLFGDWQQVVALGGASGALGIDADDHWSILLECARCPQVNVSLSYLDNPARRGIVVNARDGSAAVDFMTGTFTADNGATRVSVVLDRDETYRRQHQAVLGAAAEACTYREGYATVRLIEAIERSAAQRAWISPA